MRAAAGTTGHQFQRQPRRLSGRRVAGKEKQVEALVIWPRHHTHEDAALTTRYRTATACGLSIRRRPSVGPNVVSEQVVHVSQKQLSASNDRV